MASYKVNFGKDVLIAAIATGLKSLRNLLLIRFITVNLSLADYGIWEQIAVGIALLLPWVTLQLPSALLRFLPGINDQQRWRDDFYSVFMFVLFTTSLVALTFWSCSVLLLPPDPHFEPFIAHAPLIALLLPLTGAVNTIVVLLRALRRMFTHSILTLVQNFGEFVLIGYLLGQNYGLAAALLSLCIIRAGIVLAGLVIAYLQFGISMPTFSHLRTYISYTLPLVPNSSFYRIFDAGDRYVLSYFANHTAVGTYAAAYTMSSFFTTLIAPINMVLLPVMAELWNQRRERELGEYLTQSIRYSTLLSLPTLAGAYYLAPSLLTLLVNDAAPQLAPPFILLSCSFLVFGLGILGGNVLATADRTRLLFAIDSSLAAFNLVLNLLLVPFYGIMGAAIATFLSHIFYTALVLYKANQLAAFHIPWASILHSALGALLMIGLLHMINHLHPASFALQVALGAIFYAGFMILSGGIAKREIVYLVNIVKGLFGK